MTSRERVIRTLEFKFPDKVPRNLWKLPGVEMFRKNDLREVLKYYPEDISILKSSIYGKGERERGVRYKKDEKAIDEWGCEWQVVEDGVTGEVKNPPIKEIEEVKYLNPPYEILENMNVLRINEHCVKTDMFVLAWTTVRPFERMQFLLGSEKLYVELFFASNYLYFLRDKLHDFFLTELKMWGQTDVDGISFMDDWGSQQSLLIAPDLWRKTFKPLYRDYCDLVHSKNKFVFFHSDGYIEPIYPDLIEIGVDAVNSQLFCMDIEEIGKKYRGMITFWGEIDRQHILPFGTTEEIANAVKRVKHVLWIPEGGVIAQCEFGLKDPVENIKTVFKTWEIIV